MKSPGGRSTPPGLLSGYSCFKGCSELGYSGAFHYWLTLGLIQSFSISSHSRTSMPVVTHISAIHLDEGSNSLVSRHKRFSVSVRLWHNW